MPRTVAGGCECNERAAETVSPTVHHGAPWGGPETAHDGAPWCGPDTVAAERVVVFEAAWGL
jgi:hypothetical protein